MPLLMCPNDNASMTTMNRNGVEFDMCPTCRGVWLDRGELEKLMQSARDAFAADAPQAAAMAPQQAPQQRPSQQHHQQQYGERGEYGERGDQGERGGYDDRGQQGQRRRRGGFDMFDIFD
jgi:uncharacterized protein